MSVFRGWFLAEVLGTFLLVLFGCGSVMNAVALGAYQGLFQVAAIWGLGLTIAIYVCAARSGAHFNPAITLAFVVCRGFPARRAAWYIGAQFLGAFIAAAVLYTLYSGSIAAFEAANGITRGAAGSEASAMMFGEFYPNPEGQPLTEEIRSKVGLPAAFGAEFLGTALLALAIFVLTAEGNRFRPPDVFLPAAIGLTLTVLISIFAPLSQAGFNPARDLAPRIFSSLVGWKDIPFSTNGAGWWAVYVVAPCIGAVCGAQLAEWIYGAKQAHREISPEKAGAKASPTS